MGEGGFFFLFGKGWIVKKPRPFEKTILSVLWSDNAKMWNPKNLRSSASQFSYSRSENHE